MATKIAKLVTNYAELIGQIVEMAQDGRSLALNAVRLCDITTSVRGPQAVGRPLRLLQGMFTLAEGDYKRSRQTIVTLNFMCNELEEVCNSFSLNTVTAPESQIFSAFLDGREYPQKNFTI
jgi:hypothetical protein